MAYYTRLNISFDYFFFSTFSFFHSKWEVTHTGCFFFDDAQERVSLVLLILPLFFLCLCQCSAFLFLSQQKSTLALLFFSILSRLFFSGFVKLFYALRIIKRPRRWGERVCEGEVLNLGGGENLAWNDEIQVRRQVGLKSSHLHTHIHTYPIDLNRA